VLKTKKRGSQKRGASPKMKKGGHRNQNMEEGIRSQEKDKMGLQTKPGL